LSRQKIVVTNYRKFGDAQFKQIVTVRRDLNDQTNKAAFSLHAWTCADARQRAL